MKSRHRDTQLHGGVFLVLVTSCQQHRCQPSLCLSCSQMEPPATLLLIPDGDFELSLFRNSVCDVESRLAQEQEHKEKPGLLLIPVLSSRILRENFKNNVASIMELQ